jgi:hypothetical protein
MVGLLMLLLGLLVGAWLRHRFEMVERLMNRLDLLLLELLRRAGSRSDR